MATRRVNDPNARTSRRPPARTPEERENQLIAKAIDLAEKQIDEGTVSAQVLAHYVKMGSMREHLDRQYQQEQIEVMKMKREAMASQQRVEELYTEAMNAFRAYSGQPAVQSGDDDED